MQKTLSHTNLFRAAQHGDMQSLGVLLEQHRAGLYAAALRFLGFGEAARDAVQETFITALTHIGQVREAAAFGGWLYCVLRNYCLMQKRKEKMHGYFTGLSAKDTDKLLYEDTEQNLGNMVNEEQARAALLMLPETLRLVLLLRYFSRFQAYDSIAQILHIPIGTVRSRLATARSKLSEIIPSADLTTHPLYSASEATTALFYELWGNLYESASARERFLNMHEERMLTITNSGKKIIGRQYVKQLIRGDLEHGAKTKPDFIMTSNNITVLEGPNENSPEFPDYCPPVMAIVCFHQEGSIYRMHIYDPW